MRKFSPSMIVAMIALFVALSGTAVAQSGLITGLQIKDKSIGFKDISNTAVARLRGRVGPAGPEGTPGLDGAPGPAGGFDPNKVSYALGTATYVGAGQVVTLAVPCPTGLKAIAGGGFNSISRIGASMAAPDGTGWFLIVYNDTSVPVPNAQAFAVCAAQ
jgi:hypothetical protein